jgi:aldehyde dehydrogenase (NAD+)
MAAAARHLGSVTLELGGKNPIILDNTADIKAAAEKIASYRAFNAGQLCLCPDHVWVPRIIREEFVAAVSDAFNRMYFVDGKPNGDALGKIVDDRNFERVTGYISDAVKSGAKIVFGGDSNAKQRIVEPTVLVDVPLEASVMQDEIFGPILPALIYEDLNDVLDYLQTGGKPLAMYIYSRDAVFVESILTNTSSGGVTVNGVLSHASNASGMPFGGVNDSGIGAYHGEFGFRELSHARAIFTCK